MAEAFKNIYNRESLTALAKDIQAAYIPFKVEEFLQSVMDETWDDLELKGRIERIATKLGEYLPPDYEAALGVIDKVVGNYGTWLEGFVMYFPMFVEIYGQDDANWDVSIAALARYTQYASSELSVRAFIIKDEKRMMAQMLEWSKSESEDVRRLSSEGCRPLLPWAQVLYSLKEDPSSILPILENLKADPSETVRRSVANNLNDISKNHPDLVLEIAHNWLGDNEDTNWVVKHGLRTLLKKGDRDALALFGYSGSDQVDISGFKLASPTIAIGEDLVFSFNVSAKEDTKIRLEFAIDYVKANGKTSKKVFKISEVALKAGEKKSYEKKHSFADVSIRKHYPGIHSLTLIINGEEHGKLDFEVKQ